MTSSDLTTLTITILFGALVSGTPLLFATIGEIFSERSGVMNLGIEGMMLVGAMSGFAVWSTAFTKWHWTNGNAILFGLLLGMAFGCILSLLHAIITITLRADQVVSGLAVTFLGAGLSSILGEHFVGIATPLAHKNNSDAPGEYHRGTTGVCHSRRGLCASCLVLHAPYPPRA